MKKSILGVAATVSLLAFAGSANAQSSGDWQNITIDREAILAEFCKRYPSARVCGTTPPVRAVPEIDATSGTQALALVLGVGLLGAEGLRRRRAAVRAR
ncbi:MAG: VPEID-CTERM sorting domain-containing protein [Gammaproteobacteria bacterium]